MPCAVQMRESVHLQRANVVTDFNARCTELHLLGNVFELFLPGDVLKATWVLLCVHVGVCMAGTGADVLFSLWADH